MDASPLLPNDIWGLIIDIVFSPYTYKAISLTELHAGNLDNSDNRWLKNYILSKLKRLPTYRRVSKFWDLKITQWFKIQWTGIWPMLDMKKRAGNYLMKRTHEELRIQELRTWREYRYTGPMTQSETWRLVMGKLIGWARHGYKARFINRSIISPRYTGTWELTESTVKSSWDFHFDDGHRGDPISSFEITVDLDTRKFQTDVESDVCLRVINLLLLSQKTN